MTFHWFLSRRVRLATQMWKHVHKILCAQRDLLSAEAVANVEKGIAAMRQTIRERPRKAALDEGMAELEKVANRWLKPYPHPSLRENIEVLLVAIAVAMGIRTFFLQPFKIPTGSMQPTLYGIETLDLTDKPDYPVPGLVGRFFDYWFRGISIKHVVARADGRIGQFDRVPQKFLLFNLRQRFEIGGVWHTVWFPPDDLFAKAHMLDSTRIGKYYRRGEDVIKLRVISGDHLFVDRMTYNFRRPKRGEIVVFETRGIDRIEQQDQFYIKRLVGLGGETIRILDDRHVEVDGRRLDASTPRFEGVYSFAPDQPPVLSRYSGHCNGKTLAHENPFAGGGAPLFPNEDVRFLVKPRHYLVLGDNTMNSSDSRYWGDFPQENVIGRAFFVYWPIGAQDDRKGRFGWGVN